MNGINAYGINQFLQRRLNITDSPAPAGTLAPEVMPVIQALPPSADDLFLRGERAAGSWGAQPGGVALYGLTRLWNPTGSGTIVVLDACYIYHGTNLSSTFVGFGQGQALALTAGNQYFGSVARDSRYGMSNTNQQTVAIFEGVPIAVPAFQAGPIMHRILQDVKSLIPLDIVIAPGYCVDFWTEAVNQSIIVNLYWRERPAQPSELG